MTRCYCTQCDDGTELIHERRDLIAQGTHHQAIVNGVLGWHCPVCGEVEFDRGEAQRYSAALQALQARDAAIEKWLQDEVVPACQELSDDPSKGLSVDQVRAALAHRRQQHSR